MSLLNSTGDAEMKLRRNIILLFLLLPAWGEAAEIKVETLIKGRGVIWGFDFLPIGDILFTERSGVMGILTPATGKAQEVPLPFAVQAVGQGGLLDVRVGPSFKTDQRIFWSYSKKVPEGDTTALATGRLQNGRISGARDLLVMNGASDQNVHFGSRIEFDHKGHVFVSMGDRNARGRAQNLAYHNGKIMRLKEDGSVPKDNPFVGKKGAQPEIWTLGHRNPQGLFYDRTRGQLWEAEFGPQGGDEINLIVAGKNYGWPVVTYGVEYGSGAKIGEGTAKAGMMGPLHHWVPAISPSGMAFYNGEMFPEWKGSLFLACLSNQELRRLVLDGHKVVREESLLKDRGERFRMVREGPDGALYFSTDSGWMGRLTKGS